MDEDDLDTQCDTKQKYKLNENYSMSTTKAWEHDLYLK